MNIKVGFFDRDGTIIKDYPDSMWSDINEPIFLLGSIQTLKEVQQKGYEIIMITNQYIINEGFISFDQYLRINEKMCEYLSCNDVEILDIFYCPHGRNEGCKCIKPQPGMIKDAIMKYPSIKINESFMIGDSEVDIELAISMKMQGFGLGIDSSHPKIKKLNNVNDLIQYI
ncbi:HAD-IIIA family hydrolase [Bacillus sp. Marseille-Q3570]|uniref:D-glycero-alpha-D-manno-heptose-1,7-bisphosphate 7-phosphatase n=1 Tax=Bacillus sp. Marseille-Q3570 TaxID=2963522 RepID=UPI0021B71D0D|nr:HAD-IIIA family hydrolase [Bacillus sp. Marseille-Q3570]